MANRRQLLEAHAHLNAAIRATEPWEASYTDAPLSFKRLVKEESALQASAAGYLIGLSERVPALVNWNDAQVMKLQASAVDPISDEQWQEEIRLLTAAVLANILELIAIGAYAGEETYDTPLGITTLDEFVIKAADTQTAAMVSNVTATTRRYIQQAVKTSIQLGETSDQLIERIRKRIASPVRAEMIAQTESVTAYQQGLDWFAVQSGAVSSTWDCLLGACALCAPVNGVTRPIGKLFTLGNGDKKPFPPGHVKCRCGRILNYAK
jgi:hypothetical protein